ncbi:hypothetical protein EIN_043730, partial [Entamoeba invadens IP1]
MSGFILGKLLKVFLKDFINVSDKNVKSSFTEVYLTNVSIKNDFLETLNVPFTLKENLIKTVTIKTDIRGISAFALVDGVTIDLALKNSFVESTKEVDLEEIKIRVIKKFEETIEKIANNEMGGSLAFYVKMLIEKIDLLITNINITFSDENSAFSLTANSIRYEDDKLQTAQKNEKKKGYKTRKFIIENLSLTHTYNGNASDILNLPICPVSVSLIEEGTGRVTFSIDLDNNSIVCVTKEQYDHLMISMSKLAFFSQTKNFIQLRPKATVEQDKKAWWKYVVNAVKILKAQNTTTTERTELVNSVKEKYIALYSQWKLKGNQKPKELVDLDIQLNLNEIIKLRYSAFQSMREHTKTKQQVRSFWEKEGLNKNQLEEICKYFERENDAVSLQSEKFGIFVRVENVVVKIENVFTANVRGVYFGGRVFGKGFNIEIQCDGCDVLENITKHPNVLQKVDQKEHIFEMNITRPIVGHTLDVKFNVKETKVVITKVLLMQIAKFLQLPQSADATLLKLFTLKQLRKMYDLATNEIIQIANEKTVKISLNGNVEAPTLCFPLMHDNVVTPFVNVKLGEISVEPLDTSENQNTKFSWKKFKIELQTQSGKIIELVDGVSGNLMFSFPTNEINAVGQTDKVKNTNLAAQKDQPIPPKCLVDIFSTFEPLRVNIDKEKIDFMREMVEEYMSGWDLVFPDDHNDYEDNDTVEIKQKSSQKLQRNLLSFSGLLQEVEVSYSEDKDLSNPMVTIARMKGVHLKILGKDTEATLNGSIEALEVLGKRICEGEIDTNEKEICSIKGKEYGLKWDVLLDTEAKSLKGNFDVSKASAVYNGRLIGGIMRSCMSTLVSFKTDTRDPQKKEQQLRVVLKSPKIVKGDKGHRKFGSIQGTVQMDFNVGEIDLSIQNERFNDVCSGVVSSIHVSVKTGNDSSVVLSVGNIKMYDVENNVTTKEILWNERKLIEFKYSKSIMQNTLHSQIEEIGVHNIDMKINSIQCEASPHFVGKVVNAILQRDVVEMFDAEEVQRELSKGYKNLALGVTSVVKKFALKTKNAISLINPNISIEAPKIILTDDLFQNALIVSLGNFEVQNSYVFNNSCLCQNVTVTISECSVDSKENNVANELLNKITGKTDVAIQWNIDEHKIEECDITCNFENTIGCIVNSSQILFVRGYITSLISNFERNVIQKIKCLRPNNLSLPLKSIKDKTINTKDSVKIGFQLVVKNIEFTFCDLKKVGKVTVSNISSNFQLQKTSNFVFELTVENVTIDDLRPEYAHTFTRIFERLDNGNLIAIHSEGNLNT